MRKCFARTDCNLTTVPNTIFKKIMPGIRLVLFKLDTMTLRLKNKLQIVVMGVKKSNTCKKNLKIPVFP